MTEIYLEEYIIVIEVKLMTVNVFNFTCISPSLKSKVKDNCKRK